MVIFTKCFKSWIHKLLLDMWQTVTNFKRTILECQWWIIKHPTFLANMLIWYSRNYLKMILCDKCIILLPVLKNRLVQNHALKQPHLIDGIFPTKLLPLTYFEWKFKYLSQYHQQTWSFETRQWIFDKCEDDLQRDFSKPTFIHFPIGYEDFKLLFSECKFCTM